MDGVDAMTWVSLAAASFGGGGLLPTLVTVLGNRRKNRKLDAVVHEITPNSGKNMRDAIDRIEKGLGVLAVTVRENSSRIAALEQRAN